MRMEDFFPTNGVQRCGLSVWLLSRKTVEMSFPLLICLVAASSSLTSLPRYLIGAFTPVLIFCDEFAGLHKVNKAIIAVCVILFEVILIREWINGNSLLT